MKDYKLLKISWDKYKGMIDFFYFWLVNTHFDLICGIPRGGLIPSVSLSHRLDIPLIPFCKLFDIKNAGKSVLLIDDIVHSGKTLNNILSKTQRNVFLENNSKMVSLVKSEVAELDFLWFFCMGVYKNEWIKFPWEKDLTKEEFRSLIEKHTK